MSEKNPEYIASIIKEFESLDLSQIRPLPLYNFAHPSGVCANCTHWRRHEQYDTGDCLSPKLKRDFPARDEVATSGLLITGPNFGCVNFEEKQ